MHREGKGGHTSAHSESPLMKQRNVLITYSQRTENIIYAEIWYCNKWTVKFLLIILVNFPELLNFAVKLMRRSKSCNLGVIIYLFASLLYKSKLFIWFIVYFTVSSFPPSGVLKPLHHTVKTKKSTLLPNGITRSFVSTNSKTAFYKVDNRSPSKYTTFFRSNKCTPPIFHVPSLRATQALYTLRRHKNKLNLGRSFRCKELHLVFILPGNFSDALRLQVAFR